jgi:hypothetical protein
MSLLFSHPIKKLTLLAAFGGGYVLGTKAGRERYEQIKQTAQQVADKAKDDPRVKDVAEKVKDAAPEPAPEPAPKPTPTPSAPGDSADVHPLLADEHIGLEDTVVYSAGPDIEESIDDLIGDEPRHA